MASLLSLDERNLGRVRAGFVTVNA
jgi:hypothetical protein